MLPKQEFFDKTIRHFVQQGRPSLLNGDFCQYRGDNGTSCAVGCHIPDEVYDPEMDSGYGVANLCNRWPTINQYIPDIYLAQDLQHAHDIMDHWRDPTLMVVALRKIAHLHKLDTTVLNSLDFSNIRLGKS